MSSKMQLTTKVHLRALGHGDLVLPAVASSGDTFRHGDQWLYYSRVEEGGKEADCYMSTMVNTQDRTMAVCDTGNR